MMTSTTINSINVKPRRARARFGDDDMVAWAAAAAREWNPVDHNPRMPARLIAFVVWALVAASAAFWGLRLIVHAPAAPAHTQPVALGATAAGGDLTRVLGAAPVVPSASRSAVTAPELGARFKLLGVMAPKAQQRAGSTAPRGLALIAMDGKPARAYAVGARLEGELVLQAVSLRTAKIGPAQGATAAVLEVPALQPPATGTLPVVPPLTASPPPALPQILPPGPRLDRAASAVMPRAPGAATQ
jgi:general secretion pathway protein C